MDMTLLGDKALYNATGDRLTYPNWSSGELFTPKVSTLLHILVAVPFNMTIGLYVAHF